MEVIFKQDDVVQLSPHSIFVGMDREVKVGKPHKIKIIAAYKTEQPIRVYDDKRVNSRPYAIKDLLPYK